jgi:RimJ/RimL family protein N-acetyltransferase
MQIIEFQGHHLEELRDFAGQEWISTYLDRFSPAQYKDEGPCFSGAVSGEIIGCAGVIAVNDYRAIAWAILASGATQHFTAVHRAVKRFLDETSFKRIEAYTDTEFPEAARWVKALGFTLEAEALRYFQPDGRSASLWAKLKD